MIRKGTAPVPISSAQCRGGVVYSVYSSTIRVVRCTSGVYRGGVDWAGVCTVCMCVVVYTVQKQVLTPVLSLSPFSVTPPLLSSSPLISFSSPLLSFPLPFPPMQKLVAFVALVQAKIRQFDPPQGHLPVGNFGGAEPTMYSGAGGDSY